MTPLGRFLPIDVDLQLIILAGGLIIVDRSCDAFDPVRAAATATSSRIRWMFVGVTPNRRGP